MVNSKSILVSLFLVPGIATNIMSQTFVNGSFEVTTASMACNYNLNNGTFNGYMSDIVAFGTANETDILIDGCYTTDIPDGDRAIGIAGNRDEISLALSTPLTIGEEYTISFWTRSEITFRVRGDVEIGASTSATAFGTPIYTAVTVESTWINHVFSFVASEASTHITVRNVTGPIHWNHVDHFVMTEPGDELEVVPAHTTCFGSCDGEAGVIEGDLGPYTYLWDPAAGGGTTATATDLCAGTYTVEVTNAAGDMEELVVTIEEPEEITGGIIEQTNVSCFGGADGAVTVEASGGTGAFTCNIGDGPVDSGVFTGLAAGTYTVTIADENDCTVDVPVEIPEPEELVLTEVIATNISCNGEADGQIEVIGTGGTAPYTYSIDAVLFDVAAVFSDLAAGDYTLTVRDANGCEAALDVSLTEPEVLTLDNTVTGENCEGDCTGAITLAALGGTAPYTYSIDDCATLDPSGSFTDLCAGDYPVCVEDANGCPYNENVTVDPGSAPVDATINPFGPLCVNDAAVIVTATDMGTLSGTGITDITFDPAVAGPGTYTITNTIVEGCGGMATFDVIVNPLPNVSFTRLTNSGCTPVDVTFSSTGDAGAECEWTFGDGSFSNACGTTAHSYTVPGTYDVSLTVTDDNGCSSTVTYYEYIDVFEVPNANFDFDATTVTTLDTEVDFTDFSSTNVTGWHWDFGGYGNAYDQNPSFTFPNEEGIYDITLTVTTADGCQDRITKSLTVNQEQLIFVPNTITPDGDTYNEVFKPYFIGTDVYDYHLVLYNRWGEIVFESYNLAVGWDGMYGGEVVTDGVYIWHITTADIATDSKLEYHGHVTVLR